MDNTYFQSVPAIEVSQPLGIFYITKLSAKTLLEITFADPLRVTSEAYCDSEYPLTGAQREQNRIRLKAIASFINTTEAAFPNSIILGANYTKEGELVEDKENDSLEDKENKPPRRWRIEYEKGSDCLRLIIPTKEKLASIIDGQHRLNAFLWADEKRLATELVCAIYLDLPNPFQAALFATINFNQKKVDRSLAYLLFGMGLEDEIPEAWSPDKAAVFLSRKLNLDESSPLHQHIIVAAQNDEILFKNRTSTWAVSTATVVDGILKLFSSNPQADKDKMYRVTIENGRNRLMLGDDGTPLRMLYRNTNDLAIYKILKDFFSAAKIQFWENPPQRSAMTRTVGIQALLDVLRLLLKKMRDEKSTDFSEKFFLSQLRKASSVDFAGLLFEASGRGRSRIKNVLALKLGLITLKSLERTKDYEEYKKYV